MGKLGKQLAKKINGLTGAKKQLSALQRLDGLENSFVKLVQQLGKYQVDLNNRFINIERGLDAIAELIGREAVENKAKELHTKHLEEEVVRTTEAIQAALKAGTVEITDTIKDGQTFVIVQQKAPDGTIRVPSKIQIPLDGYIPEVKALLEGKKVGDSIILPSGDVITVLEAYQPTGKKEPDVDPSEPILVNPPENSVAPVSSENPENPQGNLEVKVDVPETIN